MTLGILYSDGKFFSDACGGLGRRILPYFILYVCRDYIYRYIYIYLPFFHKPWESPKYIQLSSQGIEYTIIYIYQHTCVLSQVVMMLYVCTLLLTNPDPSGRPFYGDSLV